MSDVKRKGASEALSPGSSMFLKFVNCMIGFVALMALVAGVGAIFVGMADGICLELLGVKVNAAVIGCFLLLESLGLGALAWIGVLRFGRLIRHFRDALADSHAG